MRTPSGFTSSLRHRMVQFIAFKRMQGYTYNEGVERLRRFDAFLTQNGCGDELLHIDEFDRYRAEIDGWSCRTRAVNLSVVRQFSRYLHAFEPESALLPLGLVPREPRSIRFYPLSMKQVSDLMAAATILKPDNAIRAYCMRFLIGLLYTTGLRIGEARALNMGDVDLTNGTLLVRKGKFGKDRIVAMSPSTHEALGRWLRHRADYAASEPSAPFFVSGRNRRLSRDRVHRFFRRLCLHCGIGGDPPPRLHDLRHNYACTCIAQWREAHEDVNALLPVLANAMGHVDFHSTEIYIHMDATALQQASEKFRQHVHHYLEH
jgi:integrase/recombinase XerD